MKNKKIFYIIGFIILLIIFPLLKPGYIFSLDQVLNPNGWVPSIGSNIFIVGILSQIFTFLHIPIWILEKILIIFTFLLPALGGYLLSKKNKNIYVILFTILFLIFNPFLYDRFMDGQINIYLSYSLYPLFLYFLDFTLKNSNKKNIILLGLFSLLLSLISIHNIVFLLFIFVIFSTFYLKKIGVKNIFKILISVLIFNLLWILPFLLIKTDKFELSKQINNFGESHRQAFKTVSGDTNLYFNTLSMHGYWGELEGRFSNINKINNKWKKLFLVILFLVLIGLYSKIDVKNKKIKFNNFEKSLILLAIFSYILALGISNNNIFSFINQALYDYLPMYSGFREPQKWVIFLVIFYAYFGGLGVKFISKNINKKYFESYIKKIILLILAFIPVFYSFQILLGFSGQISIHNYPKEWKKVKKIIFKENENLITNCKYLKENKSNKCYKTISFPWHSYMGIKFTKKLAGGWIVRYFGNNILIADNIEIRNIYTQSTRPESKIIEKYIGPKCLFKKIDKINNQDLKKFIEDLKGLGIKNIILLKEVDYKWYKEFLNILKNKKYIEITEENDMIVLYRIK